MYILAHGLILLLPGFLVCALLGIRQQVFALSFALSCGVAVALLHAARTLGLAFNDVAGIWIATLIFLAVAAWARQISWRKRYNETWTAMVFASGRSYMAGAIGIAVCVCAYMMTAGAYLEAPSDVLSHLAYLQSAMHDLDDGDFTKRFRLSSVSRPSSTYWYYLFASLAKVSGVSFSSALLQASIANVTTLLVVVFTFTAAAFARVPGTRARWLIGLLATTLFALHFGVNVFAYIRYYALAPGCIALVIYFAVMACVLNFSHRPGVPVFWIALLGLITAIAGLIHQQEGAFVLVMGTGVALVLAIERHTPLLGAHPISKPRHYSGLTDSFAMPWWILAAIAVTALVVAFFWSWMQIPRTRVFDHRIIWLGEYLPIDRTLLILNPGWQFYRVIGAWGILVYIGFFLSFKRMRDHPYLVAGMFCPLFTVFNPAFTDLFLRHSFAQNFWRFTFLIPVVFVGALLIVYSLQDLRGRRLWLKCLGASFLILTVVTLSMPNIAGVETWNRWQTLKTTSENHSVNYLSDLIEAVSPSGRVRVHTDPVTGYTLNAMTQAISIRKKFARPPVSEIESRWYTAERLPSLHGNLVVINLRDTTPSKTGILSGHWPGQVTTTSAYYDSQFIDFVNNNPDIFVPVWREDRIALFKIDSRS